MRGGGGWGEDHVFQVTLWYKFKKRYPKVVLAKVSQLILLIVVLELTSI